jgi:hypothetical protein
MEFSTLQRRITFGLIVFVLVALGAYLIVPASSDAGRTDRPTAGSSPRPSFAPASTTSPPSGGSEASGVTADIYQWLPFTPAGLTAAAALVLKFADAYGTFSYTMAAPAYAASLQTLASAQLVGQIEAAYSAPGVAAARAKTKQVSAGTAVIESIRAFGSSSLTFVVQITEDVTTTSGRGQLVTAYAITLTGSGSHWQVTDIELAAAGNT